MENIDKQMVQAYEKLTGYPLVEFGTKYSKFKMPSGKVVSRSYKDLKTFLDYKLKVSVKKQIDINKLFVADINKDLTVPLNARIRKSNMLKLKRFAKEHNLSVSKVVDKLVEGYI